MEGPIPKQADLTRKKHLAAIIKKIIKAKSHFLFHKFISTTKTFYCIIEFHPPPFPFLFCFVYFFLIRVFCIDTDDSQGSRGREGQYSSLPLPLAQKHSDIYLPLCLGDDHHVFLIATPVFTRLLLNKIYHLTELLFDRLIMQ